MEAFPQLTLLPLISETCARFTRKAIQGVPLILSKRSVSLFSFTGGASTIHCAVKVPPVWDSPRLRMNVTSRRLLVLHPLACSLLVYRYCLSVDSLLYRVIWSHKASSICPCLCSRTWSICKVKLFVRGLEQTLEAARGKQLFLSPTTVSMITSHWRSDISAFFISVQHSD